MVSFGGSLPLDAATVISNGGLHGSMSFGICPIPSTPEIALALRAGYDWFRFPSEIRPVKSLFAVNADFIFYPNPSQEKRLYLILGGGLARADQGSNKVTDPMGCGGVGMEFGQAGRRRLIMEFRLSDLSNSTYGDFRFLSLTVGLKF